jgi:hypothetical protein
MIFTACIRPVCSGYEGRLVAQFIGFVNCKMQVRRLAASGNLGGRHSAVMGRNNGLLDLKAF